MSNQDEASTRDAANVAAGSSWLFVAAFSAHLLRFVTTRTLSQFLGPAAYGLYTSATTVVFALSTVAGLGLDAGVVFLGSQARASKDDGRLKGVVLSSLALAVGSGLVLSAVLYVASPPGTPLGAALRAAAFGVMVLAVMGVGRGLLELSKDMRSFALAFHLGYPAQIMLWTVGAALITGSVTTTLYAFVAGGATATVLILIAGLRHYRNLAGGAVEPLYETRKLLAFSGPQTFAMVVRELNQWADVLMLTWLVTSTDVAVYRVALALAMVGRVPLAAVQGAFRPMVASVIAEGADERLQSLLWTVTRWLALLCAPILGTFFLLPELPLMLFDARYAGGKDVLTYLVAAEAVVVVAAPAIPVIVMSGRTWLNLANSFSAFLVNVLLNLWLIPIYGAAGAAMANLVALSAWALLFVVQVRSIFGVSAWSRATIVLVAPTVLLAGAGVLVDGLAARMLLAAVAVMAHLAVAYHQGLTEADRAFIGRIRAKLGR